MQNAIYEMRLQGRWNDEWKPLLEPLIPNVAPGSTLKGVKKGDASMQMYRGDQLLGEVNDNAELVNAFFDIWLGQNSSHAGLRKELLGEID